MVNRIWDVNTIKSVLVLGVISDINRVAWKARRQIGIAAEGYRIVASCVWPDLYVSCQGAWWNTAGDRWVLVSRWSRAIGLNREGIVRGVVTCWQWIGETLMINGDGELPAVPVAWNVMSTAVGMMLVLDCNPKVVNHVLVRNWAGIYIKLAHVQRTYVIIVFPGVNPTWLVGIVECGVATSATTVVHNTILHVFDLFVGTRSIVLAIIVLINIYCRRVGSCCALTSSVLKVRVVVKFVDLVIAAVNTQDGFREHQGTH